MNATIRSDVIRVVLLIPSVLLATFLTYWIAFGLVWLGPSSLFDLTTSPIYAVTGLFLVASFAWQFTAGRNFQKTYKRLRRREGHGSSRDRQPDGFAA